MNSAQGWARTRLAHEFVEAYRKLYLEELGNRTEGVAERKLRCRIFASARNRALTKLVNLKNTEYKRLYRVAIQKGFPPNLSRGHCRGRIID